MTRQSRCLQQVDSENELTPPAIQSLDLPKKTGQGSFWKDALTASIPQLEASTVLVPSTPHHISQTRTYNLTLSYTGDVRIASTPSHQLNVSLFLEDICIPKHFDAAHCIWNTAYITSPLHYTSFIPQRQSIIIHHLQSIYALFFISAYCVGSCIYLVLDGVLQSVGGWHS